MSLHELKKGCKIIDEITLYLMKHGHTKMNIDINKEDNVLEVLIKTSKCDDNLINTICTQINKERELEVEEYGWELMGESDAQSELGLVGLLIDKVEVVENTENCTVFKLVRKDKF